MLVEGYYGEKHAHSNSNERFQRTAISIRSAVTTAGEHEFILDYVEDTATGDDDGILSVPPTGKKLANIRQNPQVKTRASLLDSDPDLALRDDERSEPDLDHYPDLLLLVDMLERIDPDALAVIDVTEQEVYEINESAYVRKSEVDADGKASRLQGSKDQLAATEGQDAAALTEEIDALEQRIDELTGLICGRYRTDCIDHGEIGSSTSTLRWPPNPSLHTRSVIDTNDRECSFTHTVRRPTISIVRTST